MWSENISIIALDTLAQLTIDIHDQGLAEKYIMEIICNFFSSEKLTEVYLRLFIDYCMYINLI